MNFYGLFFLLFHFSLASLLALDYSQEEYCFTSIFLLCPYTTKVKNSAKILEEQGGFATKHYKKKRNKKIKKTCYPINTYESSDHHQYFVFLLMACHSKRILIFRFAIPFSTRKKHAINQMRHHFSSRKAVRHLNHFSHVKCDNITFTMCQCVPKY